MYLELVPAYGRDFTTAKAAKENWNDNKDWLESVSMKPLNKTQTETMGRVKIVLRFHRFMKTCVV
jgi:hypothetical protein